MMRSKLIFLVPVVVFLFSTNGFADYKPASTKPADDPNLTLANGQTNNLQLGFNQPSIAMTPVVAPAPAVVPLYRQTNPAQAAELLPAGSGKDVK